MLPSPQESAGSAEEPAPPAHNQQEDRAKSLTPLERSIVELEKKRFRYQGSKEQAIFRQLGLSPVAYYQRLNTMLDDPRVFAAEPQLIGRLRERRDALS